MTKEEFLEELGLTSEEFRGLMEQFRLFLAPLNEAQRKVVIRSMTTIADVASSFDPELSIGELNTILTDILEDIELAILGFHIGKVRRPNPK